jgi:Domain of unknown function (DUF4375)
MEERNHLVALGALLAMVGVVLSVAILGSGRATTCFGQWFGYTPLTSTTLRGSADCPIRGRDHAEPTLDPRPLDKLFRDTGKASHRQVADVIAADQAKPMHDSDFDDALWLALSGRIHSATDLAQYPAGVRMYFATRMVEWEIGNGGFEQVFENGVDEYFPAAKAGYSLLGDEASALLLDQATAARDDDAALSALDDSLDGPPWNGVPWSDAKRIAYVRAHRGEFRLPNS